MDTEILGQRIGDIRHSVGCWWHCGHWHGCGLCSPRSSSPSCY